MKFWILSLAVAFSVIQVSNGIWKRKKFDPRNPTPTGQDMGTPGFYRKLGDGDPYGPMPNDIPTDPEPRPRSPFGHRPHHHPSSHGNDLDNNLGGFEPDDPRRNEVDQPPQPRPRRDSGHGHHHHHHHHHSHHHSNDIGNNFDGCNSNDPQNNEVEAPPVRPRCHSDGSGKRPAPPKPPRRNRPVDGQRGRADTV